MDGELLAKLLEGPIAFHPIFSRVSGSATTGLFLSQLYYWSRRASHVEGWIYKEAVDWQEETTLTVGEQRTARRDLKRLGLIEEEAAYRHFDHFNAFDKVLCFKLNIAKLYELIRLIIKQELPAKPATAEDAETTTRESKNDNSRIRKRQFTQQRLPQRPLSQQQPREREPRAAAAEKKPDVVILENEEDRRRYEVLLKRFGAEVIADAVEATTAEGNRPYVSNIQKQLKKLSSSEKRYAKTITTPTASHADDVADDAGLLGYGASAAIQQRGDIIEGTAERC